MKINHTSWKSDQTRSSIIVQFACWAAATLIGIWAPSAALAQLPPQAINSPTDLDEGSPKTSGGFTMTRTVSTTDISYVITRPGQSNVNFTRNIPPGANSANFTVTACFVGTQGALFFVADTTIPVQTVFEPVFFNLLQTTPTELGLFQGAITFPAPLSSAHFLLSTDGTLLFTKVVHTTVSPSTMDAHQIGVFRTDTGDRICFVSTQVTGSPADSIDAQLRDDSAPNGAFDTVRIFRSPQSGTDVDLATCPLPGGPTAPQAPTIMNFSPSRGEIGTNVTVTGTNFTGATALQFNSTNASFTPNTAGTQITTTVPTGATSGRISVTTPAGTGISTSDFTIILPTVSFSTDCDVTAAEPNSNAFCTLTRTGNTSEELRVTLGIGGTAENGTDYDQIDSTVTIPPGSASTRVTIRTRDDTMAERRETVDVTIQADTAYNLGPPATRQMTIDDDEKPQISIASNKSRVLEAGADADRRATLTLTRLGSLSPALDVGFAVSSSTKRMVKGTDFSNLTSPIHLNGGASSATLFFTAVDDAVDEDDETATITIQRGTGYTTGSPSSASVTITDNDKSPTIEFADSNVTTQPICVRLSSVSERDVSVYFNLSSGSASACRDCKPRLSGNLGSGVTNVTCHGYVDLGPLPQERIIRAGSSSVIIDCMVCPGSSGKIFFVNLLAARNATLGSMKKCQVTIQ
jgi:hypothetical protein